MHLFRGQDDSAAKETTTKDAENERGDGEPADPREFAVIRSRGDCGARGAVWRWRVELRMLSEALCTVRRSWLSMSTRPSVGS